MAALIAFGVARQVVSSDQNLLLKQETAQGSLLLGSYLGELPADVSALSSALGPGGVDMASWRALAPGALQHSGEDGLAVLAVQHGHLEVLASTGTLHFGWNPAPVVAAVEHGSHYDLVTDQGSARFFGEVFPATAGDAFYVETRLSTAPFDLSTLQGHPFSNVDAAIYVGHATAADLILTTTRSLPLTGTRAETVITGGSALSSTPVWIDTHAASRAAPGSLLLVVRATGNLAGPSAALLPWVLLIGGLMTALLVTFVVVFVERRRSMLLALNAELEARNKELDRAIDLRERTDARFAAMVRSSSDLTTVIDEDGVIMYQSPSCAQLLGRDADALVGTAFVELLHGDDAQTFVRALGRLRDRPDAEDTVEWRLANTGGHTGVESRLTNLIHNPSVSGIVINSRDISDRMRLEEELRHQAFHDALTGLANRALFQDRVEHALARLSRTGGTIGVLFLDLDDFKAVNDARGHGIGDELLRAVSGRLRNTVRAGDTLARLGGDEFAVLVEGPDTRRTTEWGERILDAFKVPFAVAGGQSTVRASIGIATSSDTTITVEELLRNADIAMYSAKSAGKGRCEVFHAGLHEQVVNRIQLEADLADALNNGQLTVQYQAIIDLNSDRVTGVEALMRWHHPRRGLIMPGEFIPLAESTGLIVPMGRWLLQRACAETRAIQEECERFDLHLAVNISARQLDDPNLVRDVEAALTASGLMPGLLTLEITESVFMTDPDTSLDLLQQLKALGVKLSIDDFGTGYSSLAYLQRLPVNELKIDRSFVADDGGSEPGALVQTIVRLASNFGLTTVAEGIETEAQMQRMRRAGCLLAQGFLFARPVDAQQMRQVLTERDQPTLSRSMTKTSVSLAAIPAPGDESP